MNPVKFCKFHGFGNDYIVIENDELKPIEDLGEFSKKICHRNTGVGGDGIAVLEKLETGADYQCRIINPDGSEAGFSGNGTRCAVAYLYYKNLFSDEYLDLQTKSGVKKYQLLKREANTFWFLAELGKPKFDLPDSPFLQTIREEYGEIPEFSSIMLPKQKLLINFFFVDVGNPVVCIFFEDFEEFDWRRIGQEIESYKEMFPDRTNVVFVKAIDEKNIEIRIWERGAGETSSSGTCSIAAAVASVSARKTGRDIFVHAEGGTTEAVWREDGEMMITGRADLSFCGEFYI
ncbi:MAG: diaminopimelate epimerase [Acidobacteriota bacterium]|nr:diaminopimelate epimerase [Acidobacteriota bacterium]